MSSESFRSRRLTAAAPVISDSRSDERSLEAHARPASTSIGGETIDVSRPDRTGGRRQPLRMLRLSQVNAVTGLGKTKIYELQAEGSFPMRVKLTSHSVAWIEEDVQAWLAKRIETSPPLLTT